METISPTCTAQPMVHAPRLPPFRQSAALTRPPVDGCMDINTYGTAFITGARPRAHPRLGERLAARLEDRKMRVIKAARPLAPDETSSDVLTTEQMLSLSLSDQLIPLDFDKNSDDFVCKTIEALPNDTQIIIHNASPFSSAGFLEEESKKLI